MEHLLTNTVTKLSAPRPKGLTGGVFGLLLNWQERWRERRQLGAIEDRILKDIGLSRADIHREAQKPFWQD